MKALTELQKSTLEKLVKTSAVSDFYLAGGTALLVRYGHRFSEDFDFFCFPVGRKYGNLNFSIILKSLIYFEEAESEIYEDIEPFWTEIKEFFKARLKRYLSGK